MLSRERRRSPNVRLELPGGGKALVVTRDASGAHKISFSRSVRFEAHTPGSEEGFTGRAKRLSDRAGLGSVLKGTGYRVDPRTRRIFRRDGQGLTHADVGTLNTMFARGVKVFPPK